MTNTLRGWFVFLWYLLDPIYYSLTRLKYVKDEAKQNLIFRVRLTTYKGRQVLLSDGTLINKNDKLIKIHLHNARLLKELMDVPSEVSRARIIFQKVLEGLPALAEYIEQHPDKNEIKGIIGITTLHRGCSRLGFETVHLSNQVYKFIKTVTFLSIWFLSSNQFSLKHFFKQQPKYLFMSKTSLNNRYR
ncbi:hypothetical protein ACFSCX_18100 [Bacillus salitolerans]|uniref:YkoP-like domain-containing protein n=1 Tax=Bacillus salitolerans TaxID=1437434 RepID=A0ABW4LTF6_9BACI